MEESADLPGAPELQVCAMKDQRQTSISVRERIALDNVLLSLHTQTFRPHWGPGYMSL